MPSWFGRVYAPRTCPEKLAIASDHLLQAKEVDSALKEASPKIVEHLVISEDEKGLMAMLERYRTAEATLHAKYMAAVEAGDEGRSGFLLSEWSKMGEKCRALEKTAPAALEAAGIFVRKDLVRRELAALHAAIIKGFRQAFRIGRPRLKMAASPLDWNIMVDSIVEEVGLMLATTDFAEPLELS